LLNFNIIMTGNIQELKNRLKALEEEIKEQEARIPAHSVRPDQLIELERLENERDTILSQLGLLKEARER